MHLWIIEIVENPNTKHLQQFPPKKIIFIKHNNTKIQLDRTPRRRSNRKNNNKCISTSLIFTIYKDDVNRKYKHYKLSKYIYIIWCSEQICIKHKEEVKRQRNTEYHENIAAEKTQRRDNKTKISYFLAFLNKQYFFIKVKDSFNLKWKKKRKHEKIYSPVFSRNL